ncbi:hypothetical protein GGR58DRAFT_98849 [Xylaria digitata]|nr:hypothetical protein GGR58DRAFT_98849 [Xylaria digitata]
MSYEYTITSYDTQISPTQTAPPLTTTFTPPSRCRTPFVIYEECYNEFECYGSYLPFLYIPVYIPVRSTGVSIQCLPQTTIYYDGFVDGAYEYDPGLFCPDGMTTDTSIGSAFLCCPSGLTYSFDGYQEYCTATITTGEALAGAWDRVSENRGTVCSTITFSGNMTLYVSANPVYLTHESNAISHTIGDISTPYITKTTTYLFLTRSSSPGKASSVVPTSGGTICRRHDCQTKTSPTQGVVSDRPRSSSQIGLKVGASIGGVIALVILIVLGCILLIRYRRKRRPNGREDLNTAPTDPGVEAVRKTYEKLLPELPGPEPRAELDGTPVENRGDGIYVWKPELEGTAGIPGAVGVYVKKKSELEAIHNGVTSSALAIGARTTPTTTATPYESPIIGPSFTRPFMPTSGVV